MYGNCLSCQTKASLNSPKMSVTEEQKGEEKMAKWLITSDWFISFRLFFSSTPVREWGCSTFRTLDTKGILEEPSFSIPGWREMPPRKEGFRRRMCSREFRRVDQDYNEVGGIVKGREGTGVCWGGMESENFELIWTLEGVLQQSYQIGFFLYWAWYEREFCSG